MAASLILTFKKIFEPMPAYGAEYDDVSRKGVDGHRFIYAGKRGSRTRLTAIAFFADLSTANQARTNYEYAKGYEALLKNTLDAVQYQAFIHDVTADPAQRVESTETGITYRVRVTLDVTRTA